jgi:hypothetical protein
VVLCTCAGGHYEGDSDIRDEPLCAHRPRRRQHQEQESRQGLHVVVGLRLSRGWGGSRNRSRLMNETFAEFRWAADG